MNRKQAELSMKIHMILALRFGDGSGVPNAQMELAEQEILALIQEAREKERKHINSFRKEYLTEAQLNEFVEAIHPESKQ